MSNLTNGSVYISAKTDYAIRATIELAMAGTSHAVTAQAISVAQRIPLRFLLNILAELRRVGLVDSRRGPNGGWWLRQPPEAITVADVVRAVDGPLVAPPPSRPGEDGVPDATDESLASLWTTVRSRIRDVLEHTTVADLAAAHAGCPPGRKLQPPTRAR